MYTRPFKSAVIGLAALLFTGALGAEILVQTQWIPSQFLDIHAEESFELDMVPVFEIFPVGDAGDNAGPVATFKVRLPIPDEFREVTVGYTTGADQVRRPIRRSIMTFKTQTGEPYDSIFDIVSADEFAYDDEAQYFDVQLWPKAAPRAVANFMTYARRGEYDELIVHRNVYRDVLVSGLFRRSQEADDTEAPLWTIQPTGPIPTEYARLNELGTLAAYRGSSQAQADRRWFFNLRDNYARFAPNNFQGFPSTAVFGKATEAGVKILEEINDISSFNLERFLGSAWGATPLTLPFNVLDYTTQLNSLVQFESIDVTEGSQEGSQGRIKYDHQINNEGNIVNDEESFEIEGFGEDNIFRVHAKDTGEINLTLFANHGPFSEDDEGIQFNVLILSGDPRILDMFGGSTRIHPDHKYSNTFLGEFWGKWFPRIDGTYLGNLWVQDIPWIYHAEHQYLYLVPVSGGLFLYDMRLGSWLYAPRAAPGWFYISQLGRWAYYASGTGSAEADHRLFYLLDGDHSGWYTGSDIGARIIEKNKADEDEDNGDA